MKDYKIITNSDIKNLEKIKRVNLINALPGLRSVNLIASVSESGNHNLAIFNSVMHIGAYPALMGFIMRPETVQRQTLNNIRHKKKFTINQVSESIHKQAHLTSAKYDDETSEFDVCDLTPEILNHYPVPFVQESSIKIALTLVEENNIKANGTILVIGKIDFIVLGNSILNESGHIDFDHIGGISVNGLDTYYSCQKLGRYKFARQGMTISDL